ncbi:MAG: UDP-3-O-(3-hydroxymyristoyl)glucosamine N-acyltransferase [Rhodocyclaceae bacterium]|nr:UDP-3-O-(3-hydroxymyristoyl)glucosamine N-acyltransferase [Rhodocyclaceae bacterium]MBX3669415.1 UDP-3-O-(3-hydroxymyristoyl)glucosamine N-acyltransferase [Rhodocyclaceae bacterium]
MSVPSRAYTLEEMTSRLGGTPVGGENVRIEQVASLSSAGPRDIAFLASARYAQQLVDTRAGAVIVNAAAAGHCGNRPHVITDDPYLYFARVSQLLNPPPPLTPGVHATATSFAAEVGAAACIDAHAYVAPGVVIGADVVIGPGCWIGAGATIGDGSRLVARVSVYPGCRIGRRALIHAGAVIGADGFGFARTPQKSWEKIPQIGVVVVGDDVEIGANTSIDRGALDDTIIEDGVKLDNQIQIGHNCVIGAHTAMAGCVGVAGSTRIGKRCQIGGAAMILGHLSIADDTVISAGSMVAKSISRAGHYTGWVPAQAHADWLRNFAHIRHLEAMADKLRRLESRLAELEKKGD